MRSARHLGPRNSDDLDPIHMCQPCLRTGVHHVPGQNIKPGHDGMGTALVEGHSTGRPVLVCSGPIGSRGINDADHYSAERLAPGGDGDT